MTMKQLMLSADVVLFGDITIVENEVTIDQKLSLRTRIQDQMLDC